MRLRASLAGVALLAGSLAPAVVAPPAACAATQDHAALVIDTGERVADYCVALPDDSVTGAELIELAGEQFGLTYRFGYGGGAVCMLADVGASGDDCFEKYPDFWGYWRGDGSGGWSWSSVGATSTTVQPGDVEGWSWGSGDDGSSHPRPPDTTFEAVCGVEPSPTPKPEPSHDPTPGDGGGSRTPAARPRVSRAHPDRAPAARAPKKAVARRVIDARRYDRSDRRPVSFVPTVDAPVLEVPRAADPVPASSNDAAGGPPAAGIAGLVLALALGAGGVVVARRRGRRSA